MSFPSPVGGVSLTPDYAPSILFVILYGSLIPVFVYRLSNRRSRNTLIVGTFIFSVERVVIFSLRAALVNNEKADHSEVQTYMQTSFAAGVVTMARDVVLLLRCLLVNATYGSQETDIPLKSPALISESHHSVDQASLDQGSRDRPRLRFWFRRYADAAVILYVIALTTGSVAGGLYTTGITYKKIGDVVMILRYVSAALALLLVYMVGWAAMLARRLPRVKQRAVSVICVHTLLLAIICIYRLSVMYHRTTSSTSTAPGSLNAPAEKATFYIFHIFPEWLSAVVLLAFNVREEFGTGPYGDKRWRDETPEEKRKREMKEQAKQEKEKQKRNLKETETEKLSSKDGLPVVQTFPSLASSGKLDDDPITTVRFLPKLFF